MPDDEFLATLDAYGGTPRDVLGNPQLTELYLPILRADMRLNEEYASAAGRDRIRCPLYVLRGRDDGYVGQDDVDGWSEHTASGFGVETFDGGHFFLADRGREVFEYLKRRVNAVAAVRSFGVLNA
jgi:surfactin synthase thioesterase subunit